jgi:hydroxypyruvate isomerase
MTKFSLCAHLGYLFKEHALSDRFAAASRCGFRFVEHPAPYALAPDEASDLCKLNGLHMVQIATPMGEPGEKGLAAMVGREADFRASVDEAIAYALVLGTRYIHPMSGVPTQGGSDAESWDVYIRNVAYSCDLAARAGLTVNIEPIGAGTLAGYFMNHPDKAARAIAAVARDNLFMTFDAFHAAQSGIDLAQFTREWGRAFRHVQIADDPGRHEPGSGTLDFPAFFEALATVGYAGVIGLEYVPAADTAEGLAWADNYDRITPLEPTIDRETRT